MATPSKVHLTVNDTGIVKFTTQNEDTAVKTSKLLQENHDKHHIFYTRDGFHNHIVHHLLTLYGLGAPASVIEKRYAENAHHQRPATSGEDIPVEELHSQQTFARCLGKEKYYHSFLVFFQKEMEDKGWENVLKEYLFAGDEKSDDLLGRLYGGFLHPLIHLGFGIEFNQPAVIAEALAQAAIHDNWTGKYLLAAEKAAKASPLSKSKTLPDLLDEIRADKKLSRAAEWADGNKIRDGILVRAHDEMLKYATQWVVTPLNLEEKTAEMISTSIYFTAAAQHPPKQVKIDFYYMHCTNASIFFPTFNKLTFLPVEAKVRLLQLKGYLDLAMYPSRRSPPLLLEEISSYVPAKLENGEADWPGIFNRLWNFEDDGHAVKLGRAVRNGEIVSKKWEEEGREWVRIKGFMWEKIGNMAIDSVEDTGVPCGGTLPNGPLPTKLTPAAVQTLQLIAANELFEVAYFTELISNITTKVPGYECDQYVLNSLTAVVNQEQVHALAANGVLANAKNTTMQPCNYTFPVTNLKDAISLPETFTSVVLGVLPLAQAQFASDGGDEAGLIPVVGSIIGQEGEQTGFYRFFLTPFLALTVETIPKDMNSTQLFSVEGLVNASNSSIAYISGQNLPVTVPISNVTMGGGKTYFFAEFPFDAGFSRGLTIGALVQGSMPVFNSSAEVAAATLFGPALIEVE
ncbi:hypothetical protein G7Y89_g7417 [Cudoniella acicularis]|uniref:Uncharacterized protein n=1 Tax=Cudoniella acicularis TaxID=354080 RepID=A0A8H4RKI3_9HELO|nr:hypothetical protein G7Y89_g7417 [Cudoniella acicularis]